MKKSIFYVVLVLVFAVALAGCTIPAGTSDTVQRTISVNGTGTASANPDVAYVYLGVESVDADVAVAFADNTERMNAVYQVLQAAGIAEADLQTSDYSIYRDGPTYYLSDSGEEVPVTEATFHVTNIVKVTVRDVVSVGDLVSQAFGVGANSVQSISFAIEDTTALETEARTEALVDARARAEQMATEMGINLGDVQSASDSTYIPTIAGASYGIGGGGGVSVSSGQYEVSVQVYVVYDIAS